MKISASVPDHLWEAAQVARCLELSRLPSGRLGVAHPINPSLLVQLGLQALVRDGWSENAEVMQVWLDEVKTRMAEGILRTLNGAPSRPAPKRTAKKGGTRK